MALAAASLLALAITGALLAPLTGWKRATPAPLDANLMGELAACGAAPPPPLTPSRNVTFHRDVPLAPWPLPAPHAESDGEAIVELFQALGRSTVWRSVANVSFEGDTFEPEGMVRLGPDRFVVSCGEYTERTERYGRIVNGTDRSPGKGFAHLVVFDGQGRRIADATITRAGALEYHNGGIDYDGRFIWGTVGQYRPNSTALVYKADPSVLEPRPVVRYADHLGGIVRDGPDDSIACLNWGSRSAAIWGLGRVGAGCDDGAGAVPSPVPRTVVRNPSSFVDYQDCKWLGRSRFYGGRSVMLCSGVATVGGYDLGGVALVDVASMAPLAEVPVALESALGVRMTQNPVDVSVHRGRLRFYWLPDQRNSTLYVYEAQP
ncbi:hypothetical protein CDD83_10197 [Cordyceps sp. RAO-2017]|nr:hypothetical protein CDD83_10197 [Cordyceps sp. RAO-2017]